MPGRFVYGRLKTQRPRVRRRTGYRLRYRANRAPVPGERLGFRERRFAHWANRMKAGVHRRIHRYRVNTATGLTGRSRREGLIFHRQLAHWVNRMKAGFRQPFTGTGLTGHLRQGSIVASANGALRIGLTG